MLQFVREMQQTMKSATKPEAISEVFKKFGQGAETWEKEHF